MKIKKRLNTVVAMSFFLMALGVGPAPAEEKPCLPGSFTDLGLPDTTISLAESLPAGPFDPPGPTGPINLPAFCRVAGTVAPAINFEVWMPLTGADWNGKFNGVGNGGLAGSISYSAMGTALNRKYATASTDTGHQGSTITGPFDWATDRALLTDFATRSIHVTTVAAKAIIERYYGQSPLHSYFTGCSGGGGQALSEAQRYPNDYDGIVAGAPANFVTHMWPGELWPALVTYNDKTSTYPDDYINKLPLITRAALAACDGLDGLWDGVIDDPSRCDFDPSVLLCRCRVTNDCLTAPQVESIEKIYAGLWDPFNGEQIWPGFEASSEFNWGGHIVPFTIPQVYFQSMILGDPIPDFDTWWKTFDFSDPADYALYKEGDEELGPVLNSIDPNLSIFRANGGKLIMYHGWIDQNIAPRNSISYYQSVMAATGSEAETMDFLRLFMAPGMAHCSGGPGPNTFDSLGALEQWVENGIRPEKIIASHSTGGMVDRTRPLCPYPKVARYLGTGSIDRAENFTCVEIIPAEVRIEPETLNLRSKGVFTAFITLPQGYEFMNFIAVTCEGAPKVRDNYSHQGRVYQVKFNRQDLMNVKAGKHVPFTVTAIFERNGQKFALEGTDRIRVGFDDVHAEHWADDHIIAISNQGITAGCTTDPTNYCPDTAITRGQMSVFLVTSLGQSPASCTGRFADVPVGDPFCGFVEQLAANGITGGCGGGRFCPNDPITRGQMAVFLEAALGHSVNSCAGRFADVPNGHPFCGFIERLADDGITGGCGPGAFCPETP